MATFEEFKRLYTDRPYLRYGLQRGVGVEHELLLVHEDGSMGDALRVIEDLSTEHGWRPEYDKFQPDLLIAARHDLLGTMTVDAGKGTLEWVSPRFDNLHELDNATKQMQNIMVGVAARSAQYILGVGMQPKTPASCEMLIPKKRYQLFLDRFGARAFGGFSVNASLQVSVDARNPDDLHELTVHMQALSSLIIGVTANSPIAGGMKQNRLASRFDVWNAFDLNKGFDQERLRTQGRIGIPVDRPKNLEAYLKHLWGLEYVFGPDGNGGHQLFGRPFGECAENLNGELRTHASYHRSCGWFDARACFEGTHSPYVESRQPCQQPQGDQTAVAALILGLAENPQGRQWLAQELPWATWRCVRDEAATYGMATRLPWCRYGDTVRETAAAMIGAARVGLKHRGLGEEHFLRPLYRRLDQGPPALAQIAAFEKGGIPELVEQFRFRVQP